jgi:uncharacterized SAM-binding protein YcdF (DUF218 family)
MEQIPGPRLPAFPAPSRRSRRRWALRGIALCAAVGLIVAFGPTVLSGYARSFRVDNPAPADAIVLLLGGIGERPERVAELYHQGYAPRILFGDSGLIGGSSLSESRETRRILIENGVPASAITILPPPVVTSTFMEAQAVLRYAEAHRLRRIIVVTTAFHTRRARWVFRHVFSGAGIDIRAAAAAHSLFHEGNWYRSDEGLVTYVDETIKSLYYWIAY